MYVQNLNYLVEIQNKNLFHISNGHCACDISVSPYRLVENVVDILNNIEGDFNYIIIDSEEEDIEVLLNKHKDFNNFLNKFPQLELSFNNFILKYPHQIKFDTLYKIKR